MSEQPQEQIEEQVQEKQEEPPQLRSEDVIEIEWEEIEQLVNARASFFELENKLAKLLLDHEKKKAVLMSRSARLESLIYEMGEKLRDDKNITSEYTYEIRMPTSEGEKAYFVRKDS